METTLQANIFPLQILLLSRTTKKGGRSFLPTRPESRGFAADRRSLGGTPTEEVACSIRREWLFLSARGKFLSAVCREECRGANRTRYSPTSRGLFTLSQGRSRCRGPPGTLVEAVGNLWTKKIPSGSFVAVLPPTPGQQRHPQSTMPGVGTDS